MAPNFEIQERTIVDKCLEGDGQAWDQFLRIHYKIIAAVVRWRKWGFERAETDDIIQEIMTEIVKALETFHFKSKLSTFVYSISVNTCITYLRKKKALKRQIDFEDVPEDAIAGGQAHSENGFSRFGSTNPEELAMNREIASIVLANVTKLSDQCRELIRYRYFEDLTFQDIAGKTGTKKNTLVIQMRRCLERLHKHLYSEISNEQ